MSTVAALLDRYGALIRVAWLVDLQYRAAILIWLVLGVTQPMVMLAIWWSVAAGGAVGGYGQADFARYFFALLMVEQLTVAWDIWYIDRWIREGELNTRLVRPISPIHEAIADNLAYKVRAVLTVVAVWAAAAVFWPAVRLPFDLLRWGAALPAVLLAGAIQFLVSYVCGLLAFWTTRATGVFELQYGLSLFLAGRIAPLALLPPAVAAVAGVLWFRYTLSFPVEVLTGSVATAGAYGRGLAMQVAWLAAWSLAYRVVWRVGVKRYEGVGG